MTPRNMPVDRAVARYGADLPADAFAPGRVIIVDDARRYGGKEKPTGAGCTIGEAFQAAEAHAQRNGLRSCFALGEIVILK